MTDFNTCTSSLIDDREDLFSLVLGFGSLSDLNRFRIFCSLADKSELTLNDVADILDAPRSAVLKNLKKLELINLIKQRYSDSLAYYSINLLNPAALVLLDIIM